MSIRKVLKEQKEFLTKATREIGKHQVKTEDLNFPEKLKKSREDDIKERIETLKKQKEEVIERYDRAIDEQKKELVRLEKEIHVPGLKEVKEQSKRPPRTTVKAKAKKTTNKATKKTAKKKKVVKKAKPSRTSTKKK